MQCKDRPQWGGIGAALVAEDGREVVGIQSPTATGILRDCAAEGTVRQISAIPRNSLRGRSIWRGFLRAAKVAVRWGEARYLAFWGFFAMSNEQVGRPKCAQKGEGGPSGGNFRRRRHLPSNRRGKRPRWPPPRRPSRAPTRTHTTRGHCAVRGAICKGASILLKFGTGVDLDETSAGRQSASPYLQN